MNNAPIYVLCFLGGVLLYLATYHARIVWDDYKQKRKYLHARKQHAERVHEKIKQTHALTLDQKGH